MRASALFMKGVLSVAVLAWDLWTPTANAQQTQPGAKVELVGRSIKAINYQHRSGETKIDIRGTPLLSGANGEAKVESKRGYLEVDAEFRGLAPARTFGSEYFTYVLWAITPDGRPENLGEVLLNNGRGKLHVTTQLQAFGLVVTAEPYFSVTYPSDVVVLENAVRSDTRGRVDEIEARYELLRRGQYVSNEKPDELTAKLMVVDSKVPLQLYEARNAIRIARWTGAEKYAPEPFNKAVEQLLAAERYQARKRPETKAAAMMARQAVQTAEDARLLTVRRLEEERLAAERKAAAEREAVAKAKAEAESRLRAKAELDMQQVERLRAEAEAARQMAEQERLKSEKAAADANRNRQEAEQMAQQAERHRAEALAELKRVQLQTQQELAKLEAARTEALAQKAAAEAAVQKLERERAELRQRLQMQLNKVLETTNTARGLIVNMSDVLFDTAKYTLRPSAREKLARISGILAMQPELRVEVEGHTDSVGGDAYNQRLSEDRADAVRSFLIEQGIDPDSITARGFGETNPKASNESAAGRQQNRRVELVVSGSAIGTGTP